MIIITKDYYFFLWNKWACREFTLKRNWIYSYGVFIYKLWKYKYSFHYKSISTNELMKGKQNRTFISYYYVILRYCTGMTSLKIAFKFSKSYREHETIYSKSQNLMFTIFKELRPMRFVIYSWSLDCPFRQHYNFGYRWFTRICTLCSC